MLKLVGGNYERKTCPTCKGVGRVPCPETISSLTPNENGAFTTPGTGFPIPCPECKGKKTIAVAKVKSDGS